MNNCFFVTGIGTGVGKTLAAAVLTKALGAAYWKPVQAGFDDGTDSTQIQSVTCSDTRIFPETYKLRLPASPHIAARQEGVRIEIPRIADAYQTIRADYSGPLVIEGAGGLMVPLNERDFISDLAAALASRLVLVSRNYLGSINHSLLTAGKCRQNNLDVAGWIFNDQYLDYEPEIISWSGYPALFSLAKFDLIDRHSIAREAERVRPSLAGLL